MAKYTDFAEVPEQCRRCNNLEWQEDYSTIYSELSTTPCNYKYFECWLLQNNKECKPEPKVPVSQVAFLLTEDS